MKKITLLLIISLFINGVFGDEVSVMEGDSVTLHTNDADIKSANDVTVIWTFGAQKTRIAKINREANTVSIYDDVFSGRFKGRLQVNDKTGDLTITNIKTTDSGLYEVQISVGSKNVKKNFDVKGVYGAGEVKTVSVMEGDSVTLHTDVSADVIEWRFGPQETLIAQINKTANKTTIYDDVLDGRFRDRLQVNDQTGDLTITDIRMDQFQVYKLDLTSSSYTIHQSFTITVSGEVKPVSVMVGGSVTLYTDVPDIKTYDLIQWMFGVKNTQIAEMNSKEARSATFNVLDGKFSDRLKMNSQTGSLTINDVKTDDFGQYAVKMSSRRRSIHRTLSVDVSERGQSPGAIAGISVFLILLAAAAAAAAGVIYHRRMIAEEQKKLGETLLVKERESVVLKTKVKDMERVEKIEWKFRRVVIAKFRPGNRIDYNYDYSDLFKDKLKLNHQTGDLTIHDIREKHEGEYILTIIRDEETTNKIFNVFITDEIKTLEVDEGSSVDLKTKVKDIKKDDVIQWRSGETLIAEINPANNIFNTSKDDLFRDKLKLNRQTGDLTINDSREKHTGVYKLKIIRDGETSDKRFNVTVTVNVKELKVNEEESADLKTGVTDIQRDDVIEWRFGRKETLIAKINPAKNIFSTYDGDDDLFKDKLKLNHQTGDLNISDITWEHGGVYKLKIIRDGETSERKFAVFVKYTTLEVDKGSSVDLKTKVKDIQRFEKMEWRFGGALIAEINPADNIFNTYNVDTDLFRDKLELNRQTGDLNINDIREEHEGEYILLFIRGRYTSDKRFIVFVRAGGDSVEKRGEDSVGKRGEDSVGIVMPLLKNSS